MRERPSAVAPVVACGDLRASLAALRDRLAAEIDGVEVECDECGRVDGRVIATLTKELAAVLATIDALPIAEGASRIDELANARKSRQSRGGKRAADVAARAAVPGDVRA